MTMHKTTAHRPPRCVVAAAMLFAFLALPVAANDTEDPRRDTGVNLTDCSRINVNDRDLTGADSSDAAAESVDEHFEQLFANIDEMRHFGQLKQSIAVGGTRGGRFEVIPDESSVLVGFMYTASRHYVGHLTIKAIRPIFRGRHGESIGEWCGVPRGKVRRVEAEDGYVVAGLVAKSGNRVDGIRLIYMRVKNGRLNPDDTYRSEWIGGRRGNPETLCAANGHPLIGIYGRKGADLDAIGFIQADPTPSPEPLRSLEALMPQLTGKWVVTYTNNTQHTREINENQLVNDGDEIIQQNEDILIVFPNVIERITLADDKLFVEHFNPRSTYPDGIPAVMGVARKAEME